MPEFATTLHYAQRPEWNRRGQSLTADSPSPPELFRRLVRTRAPVLVLNGFGRADLAAAAVLARRRRPPRIIITDCTWQRSPSRADALATRAGIRALDGKHVTYCVLSDDERRQFPRTWGVEAERVTVVPWYHGLTDEQLAQESSTDGAVFSGGRSLRDYRPLIEAARDLPFTVRVAAPRSALGDGPLPASLDVGEVTPQEYHELMRRAACIVLPLEARTDRSAGQTTYLDAMAMRKYVIVTETMGVREYVQDGVTGRVVAAHDGAALGEAIRWAVDPANAPAVAQAGARAREVATTRFSPDGYVRRLLELVSSG